MSVAKTGSDDHNCGLTNHDPMHQAICRLVASGVTVVAAAGNNHFNAARLGPGRATTRSSRSRRSRTATASPGGVGGNACYSWGTLRQRRHVRQLLELRPRRRPDRARQVHLVDRARRLRPTLRAPRWRRPHVTGAAALYKASRPLGDARARSGPRSGRAGNYDWKTGDATPTRPRAAARRLAHRRRSATSRSCRGRRRPAAIGAGGGTLKIRVEAVRAEDVAGRDRASRSARTRRSAATLADTAAVRVQRHDLDADDHRPAGHAAAGPTASTVTGNDRRPRAHGPTSRSSSTATAPSVGRPTLGAPRGGVLSGDRVPRPRRLAGGHRRRPAAIGGYQARWRVDGGAWGATTRRRVDARRRAAHSFAVGHTYRSGCGPGTRPATGAPGASRARSRRGRRRTPADRSSAAGPGACRTSGSSGGGTTRYARRTGRVDRRTFTGRGDRAGRARWGPTRGAAQGLRRRLARRRPIHLAARHLHTASDRVHADAGRRPATHTIRIVVARHAAPPPGRRRRVRDRPVASARPRSRSARGLRSDGRVAVRSARRPGSRRTTDEDGARPWHARCGRGPSSSAW